MSAIRSCAYPCGGAPSLSLATHNGRPIAPCRLSGVSASRRRCATNGDGVLDEGMLMVYLESRKRSQRASDSRVLGAVGPLQVYQSFTPAHRYNMQFGLDRRLVREALDTAVPL